MSNLYTDEPVKDHGADPARAAAAGLCLLATLAIGGCHRHIPAAAPPAVVVALTVHPYLGAEGGEPIRYPVEVAARYANVMAFRVAGQITERNVRLGDAVHRGQVLARLDPVDAQKQAAAAKAALTAADHRLVFAKQQLDRDQAQSAQNLIAANQFEQTQDAYSAALAGREQSASQWVVARNTLQYNSLVADHDGVITSENADTGQVVAAGQAVYGLAWAGDTDVTLDAAASDLDRIAIGEKATVTFPALPGRSFIAQVREMAPEADPQSRTYRVKLTLTEAGTAVRLGMTGEAVLSRATTGPATPTTAPAGVPLFEIPATALFHRGKDPAVWVIRANDSSLELRPVTVSSYSERAAMVTAGLKDGETVVSAGVHTVHTGQFVKPVAPLFADEAEIPR